MLFLMDLPAPVHGMANVNSAILNEARGKGLTPRVINTAPSYAAFLFGTPLWGGVKVVHSGFCFIRLFFSLILFRDSVVYRPINGGGGQLYDCFYLSICRLFGAKLYIHHHSFNYLNRPSRLFAFLNKLSGPEAVHITLGQKMSEKLLALYLIPAKRLVELSNIAFFGGVGGGEVKSGMLVLGHLANLCVDKGVNEFVALCNELDERGVKFIGRLAGPFADELSEDLVQKACASSSKIEYLGPLYGKSKDRFFSELDVFVFPSRYSNEAEPLVLYEAGLYGSVNIGTKRGCMEDVIAQLGGYSFDEDEELVSLMSEQVFNLVQGEGLGVESRKERIVKFESAKVQAERVLQLLLKEMAS